MAQAALCDLGEENFATARWKPLFDTAPRIAVSVLVA